MTQRPFDFLWTQTSQLPFFGAGIVVEGPDALSFLHRMSTQDLFNHKEDAPLQTAFLNSQGRIVDAPFVFRTAPEKILLLSLHPQPEHLLSWLSKYHFAEALSLKAADCIYPSLILGSGAESFLRNVSLGYKVPFFSLTIGSDQTTVYLALLQAPIATLPMISQEVFEDLRIAAIQPGYPFEICDSFHPLEVGLAKTISWEKGCYVGQEVIAKIETYQKHPKKLFGIHASSQVFPLLKPKMPLWHEGRRLGFITSVSHQFHAQIAVALGIVENDSPSQVEVLIDEIPCTVTLESQSSGQSLKSC